MIRTLAPLVVVVAMCAAAAAQHPIIRHGGPPQPQGVIPPPSLPVAGTVVGGVPGIPGTAVARPFPRPFAGNALFGAYGYDPGYYYWPWPDIYDAESMYPAIARAPQFTQPPVYAPTYVTVAAPSPPEDLRARVAMTVPMRAKVWLNGKEVDANVAPLVLQSPPLQEGQTYTFDIKVTWPEGNKTEERTRSLVVGAGEQTSLTYQR
jgi:uncharacterized protein (TIGR03000 family)